MFHRGEFDRKITIYPLSEAITDGYGEVVTTEGTGIPRWAKKKEKGGTENVEADRIAPILKVEWIFDYIDGLNELDIIRDRDGREYDILVIEELDRKRYHRCHCAERR